LQKIQEEQALQKLPEEIVNRLMQEQQTAVNSL
jgi:hypothetical protein